MKHKFTIALILLANFARGMYTDWTEQITQSIEDATTVQQLDVLNQQIHHWYAEDPETLNMLLEELNSRREELDPPAKRVIPFPKVVDMIYALGYVAHVLKDKDIGVGKLREIIINLRSQWLELEHQFQSEDNKPKGKKSKGKKFKITPTQMKDRITSMLSVLRQYGIEVPEVNVKNMEIKSIVDLSQPIENLFEGDYCDVYTTGYDIREDEDCFNASLNEFLGLGEDDAEHAAAGAGAHDDGAAAAAATADERAG